MQKLHIAKNGRYFEKDDGTPFIWIADTAWTMPQRMKWDDVEYYMKKRKSQGFTILQIVALDPERDEQMRTPVGSQALIEQNILQINEAYFQYLDWILDRAEFYGFYVLLLPAWGQLITGDCWGGNIFEKTINESNAKAYGEWIGSRYKDRRNILWCLGGDRQPIHKGNDFRMVWRAMAEGLGLGITGKEVVWNKESDIWRQLMLTYHTCYEIETGKCSTMSYWTDEDVWIQYIMLQSGHKKDVDNYNLVTKEYNRIRTMPVWDGEPAYERMPTSWPQVTALHSSWSIRKRAYWSLFAGAFGYTYGHASVWCMISEKEKNEVLSMTWYEALDSEGSQQIKVLRDFLEYAELTQCCPFQELLIVNPSEDDDINQHKQACIRKDTSGAYIYFPSGGTVQINRSLLSDTHLYLWWLCPRDGKFYDEKMEKSNKASVIRGDNIISLTSPTQGVDCDWVAIICANGQEPPVKEKRYFSMDEENDVHKVFDWAD